MDKYIGKKLDGRYDIIECVGTGGMASVYRAKDIRTGNTVAIKILHDEYLKNTEICQRFRNESKAISLLNHKNIIKVYDVCDYDHLHYIVMEYIDGVTLKEYMQQQGVLKWREAVHFTTQILRGLQHAHSKGIVHRDVKPQNIMLLSNGDIKVTDFGIARFDGSERDLDTNKAIGSVHYISPEQASGSRTDSRSDIYSVGVILYEMCTGRLPFDGKDTVSVAVMHLQADPRMPREINPAIPEGLEEIIMQAMQKDPVNRYQNAADMIYDVDEFKKDPQISFDYHYLVDDSPARYISAVNQTRKLREEQEREKSPVIPVLTGIAMAFVLVAVVMVWLVLDESGLFSANSQGSGQVPNFIGMDYREVVANPEYSYVFLTEWVFSDEYDQNVVVNQNPKADKNAYNNARITLTISKGPERLLVPEFVGYSYDEYSQLCVSLGLVPIKVEVFDEDVGKGEIIGTTPAPRTDIGEGGTVQIYVSQGVKPSELTMPNCLNMLYSEAKVKLETLGITKTKTKEVDSDKPAGTILSQSPAEGTVLADENVQVTFTISNGTAPKNTVEIEIDLPGGLESESLRVEVIIDDSTVYKATIDTADYQNSPIKASITGSGTSAKAKVYLAGSLYQTITINFSKGTIKNIQDNPDYRVPTTTTTTSPDDDGGAVG